MSYSGKMSRRAEQQRSVYRTACHYWADGEVVSVVEDAARNFESITDDGDPAELRLCRAAQRRGR